MRNRTRASKTITSPKQTLASLCISTVKRLIQRGKPTGVCAGPNSGHRVRLGSSLRPLSRCTSPAHCETRPEVRLPCQCHLKNRPAGLLVIFWKASKPQRTTPSLPHHPGPCPNWSDLRMWEGMKGVVKQQKIMSCGAISNTSARLRSRWKGTSSKDVTTRGGKKSLVLT